MTQSQHPRRGVENSSCVENEPGRGLLCSWVVWVRAFLLLMVVPCQACAADMKYVVLGIGGLGVLLVVAGVTPGIARALKAKKNKKQDLRAAIRDPRVAGIIHDLFPDDHSLPPPGATPLDHLLNRRLPKKESVLSFVRKVFDKHGIYLPETYAEKIFVKEVNQAFYRQDDEIRSSDSKSVSFEERTKRRTENLRRAVERGIVWIEKLVDTHRREVETSAEQSARRFLVRVSKVLQELDAADETERLLRHETLTPQERYAQDVNFFYAWLQAFEKALKKSNLMKPEARHIRGTQPAIVERTQHRVHEIVREYLEITNNRRKLQAMSPLGEQWDEVIYKASVNASEAFDRKQLANFQKIFLECDEPFRNLFEAVKFKELSVDELKNLFREHEIFPQRIVVLGNRLVVANRAVDRYNRDLGPFALPKLVIEKLNREESEEADSPLGYEIRQKNAENLREALRNLLDGLGPSRRNEVLRGEFEQDEGPRDGLGRFVLILPIAQDLTYEDEMVLADLRFFPSSGLDKTQIAVVSFAETDIMWNSEQADEQQRTAAYDFFISNASQRPLLR